jgi:peroxiredoxin
MAPGANKVIALFAGILLALTGLGLARAQDQSVRQGPRRLQPNVHGVGRMVPDVAVTDIQGKQWRLSDFKRERALVIALTSATCPVSQRYAPALARLEESYRPRGVAFLFLNPIASEAPAELKAAVRTHGFDGPYARDRDGTLARTLGALTTADVFVLDPARTLVYRGAVDDQYGLGYALDAPRRSYLSEALDALLAGRSPEVAATWAPGCDLDLEKAKPVAVKATYYWGPQTYDEMLLGYVEYYIP